MSIGLSACMTSDPQALAEHDPYEPTNRFFFGVTQKADKVVLKPAAKAYVAIVPQVARDGIHNMLVNVNLPVVFGNEVLQGSEKSAAQTLGRFVVNTTVGVGGIFDIATKLGIPSDDQDGGITLGKWGISEGPYLFLPLLGPSSPRDVVGRVGDTYLQPLHYADFPGDLTLSYARQGMSILDQRSAALDTLDSIERTSVDFYATTRSLYRQHRNAQITGGKTDTQTLPNF
ncbi:MAG: VacJ family lipoprotein [Alphaproteobacteria bacterium]|nr:VacJ family lipoprotein [Alphaproteobacteria bacterium]